MIASCVAAFTASRYAVAYVGDSIFGDKRTAALFEDQVVRDFQGIARRAKLKLEAINAASRISDLAVPPSNHLEKLRGDLEGFYSVRINDQWRVVFRWSDGDASEVRIVDYH